MTVDAAQPPQIVVQGEPCQGAYDVAAQLSRMLGDTRAPSPGWVLAVRVERVSASELRAEGDLTDGDHLPIGRRVLVGAGDSAASLGSPAQSFAEHPQVTPVSERAHFFAQACHALSQALGVWAALVLEAERSRSGTSKAALPEVRSRHDAKPDNVVPTAGPAVAVERAAFTKSREEPVALSWPRASQPTETEATPVEAEFGPTRAKAAEVGVGSFVMAGPDGEALVGVTPSASLEWGHGWRFRPSVAVARALLAPAPGDPEGLVLARADVCVRAAGLYAVNRGLWLDLCGGADGGAGWGVRAGPSAEAFASVGPSADLAGSFGSGFALVLRGVGGANIMPVGLSGRFEFALSWRLP